MLWIGKGSGEICGPENRPGNGGADGSGFGCSVAE